MNIQDNSSFLKNFGMQLQMMGSQIQNMGVQISTFNQQFGMQMQSIAIQITNISMHIFKIGMETPNFNQIQDNLGNQILNNLNEMNNLNIMNQVPNIEMNNNIINNDINNINDLSNKPKINIKFGQSNGKCIVIIISPEMTIEDLLNSYRIKIGESPNFLENHIFLFNGQKININEKKTIKDFGLINGSQIFVYKLKDVEAGPNVKIKIYDNEYLVYSDNIYNYLVKYLEKIGKTNIKDKINCFNVNVYKFFQTISESK